MTETSTGMASLMLQQVSSQIMSFACYVLREFNFLMYNLLGFSWYCI